MKKSTKILSLSAAALLVLVIAVILIRRRGRKVYLKDEYKGSDYNIYVFSSDFSNSVFYQGTLEYVILPFDYEKRVWVNTEGLVEPDGSLLKDYVPVKSVGVEQPSGRIKNIHLKGGGYIASDVLNL